jgi:TfoX/Sxy family transcriptional regulator of competence genes
MTYNEQLVERIRRVIPPATNIDEKKMFGGVAFLADGKMFVGVANDDLMVRVGPDAYTAALARTHVRPMDFTGRPLTGYVYVNTDGTRTDAKVSEWVQKALTFVGTLPAKKKTAKKPPRPRPKRTRKPRKR